MIDSAFAKYRNPDKRCGYPFTPEPCGYCWSYAHHVDGTRGCESLENVCRGCDLFHGGLTMDDLPKPYYYPLFAHLQREHGLTLTDSELSEIADAAAKCEPPAPGVTVTACCSAQ